MLHLFPIRWILTAIIAVASLAVLVAVYLEWVGAGNTVNDAVRVFRWSAVMAIAVITLFSAMWRWIPLIQRFTFPYLGGHWSGELLFSGTTGSGRRPVTLDISHNPFQIKLILKSEESTSRTLVVHAESDSGIGRKRLYYVYLNERNEGVIGAGDAYRGLAIMRVEIDDSTKLYGDYFTEQGQKGTLALKRDRYHFWLWIWL